MFVWTLTLQSQQQFLLTLCIIHITLSSQGTNAAFSYSISGTLVVPFAVDPVTGVVTVNAPLDYETQPTYQFLVILFT